MSIHFQRELEKLRGEILALGAEVEDALSKAILALMQRDQKMAEQVMNNDDSVDRREIEVEESCLKILALHQPVAHDLRFLVAVLKMNNDLERMGDIAANIAKRARWLSRHDPLEWPPQVVNLAERVKDLVRKSLDALVNANLELANEVCLSDNEVNALKATMVAEIRRRIHEHPEQTETLLKMLDVPRHLERIGDLATNIAEDVIYMIEGRIVRHRQANVE